MTEINIKDLKKTKSKSNKKSTESWFDLLNKDIKFGGNGLGDQQRQALYDELSVLLNSGLDLVKALQILCEDRVKQKEVDLLTSIINNVVNGMSFSESLKKTTYFSDYELFSIQIGEETGRLTKILNDLSLYYAEKIKQRRQIIGALSYPIVVLGVAFGAIAFMLQFIVPMFSDVFKRFGGDLPAITQWVINLSNSFSDHFVLIFFILITIVLLFYISKSKVWFRKYSSQLLLKIPVIGPLILKIHLARFCSMMSLMISSKIHLMKAVELIEKVIQFYPIHLALKDINRELTKGNHLYDGMVKHSIFKGKMVSLVKVGEEVNKLDEFFNKLNVQYSEEVDHQTKVLGNLLEPFLLIFLGIIVGFVLISMYLPLFQLSTNFG